MSSISETRLLHSLDKPRKLLNCSAEMAETYCTAVMSVCMSVTVHALDKPRKLLNCSAEMAETPCTAVLSVSMSVIV